MKGRRDSGLRAEFCVVTTIFPGDGDIVKCNNFLRIEYTPSCV